MMLRSIMFYCKLSYNYGVVKDFGTDHTGKQGFKYRIVLLTDLLHM